MFKIEEIYFSHPDALKWDLSTFMKIDFELLFQLKPEIRILFNNNKRKDDFRGQRSDMTIVYFGF